MTSSFKSGNTVNEHEPWWRQAVVYQVYPRSFADANGDGLGDIPGLTSRADYLAKLGINAVWLSPFYPSKLADGGYDVADYRNVDPRLGTLKDFDQMLEALHQRGIKVVVDIVPNHTSDQHEWFQAALAAQPGSPERERYIFRNGSGPGGAEPPADWLSVFGGPAWTQVEDGQWYLHSFAREQPDLNWDNPQVREDFIKTLRFWSDRGVDGFRIDVAHMLTKDLTGPLPSREELLLIPQDGNHPLIDRDDVHEVYAQWRKVFDSYDPPRTAVAEAWVHPTRIHRYAHPESLGQAFNFDLLVARFDAEQFRRIITENLTLAKESGSSSTWVLSNHDVVRHATRYGIEATGIGEEYDEDTRNISKAWLAGGAKEVELDREKGLRRARAATLFILGLPGSTYLYQGEELGLHEVGDIPATRRQDPTFFRTHGAEIGRDGCRVPLPWAKRGESLGFGDAQPHLPQPAWFADFSVEAEEADPASTLNFYRQALKHRQELLVPEDLEWLETGRPDVLAYRRPGAWTVVTNFGVDPYSLDSLGSLGGIVIQSQPGETDQLLGETTAWLVPEASD